MDREPLGKIALLVAAALGLLAAFGVQVTADQVNAATTLVTAAGPVLAPLVVWWLGRQKVTPVDSPQSPAGEPLVPASTTVLMPPVEDS